MKKTLMILFVILTMVTMSGCYFMRPESYQMRTAYYQAQAEVAKAYAARANAPLVTLTTTDGQTLSVANPTPVVPMRVVESSNEWADVTKAFFSSTPLSLLAGGWAVREIVKRSTGDIDVNGDGNDLTTNNNSFNTNELTSTTVDDGATQDNHVDNSDSRQNYDNATAPPTVVNQPAPTIVTQPAPIIVKPEVVNPVVVNPEVVNPVVVQPGN